MTCLRRANGEIVRQTYDHRGLPSLRSRTLVVHSAAPGGISRCCPAAAGVNAFEQADALEWLHRQPLALLTLLAPTGRFCKRSGEIVLVASYLAPAAHDPASRIRARFPGRGGNRPIRSTMHTLAGAQAIQAIEVPESAQPPTDSRKSAKPVDCQG